MSEQLSTFFCASLEVIIFLVIYHSYTGIRFNINNPRIAFVLVKIVVSVLLSYLDNPLLFSVFSVLSAFILYHLYYEESLVNSLFYYSFCYIMTALIEIPVALITMPFAKSIDSNIYNIIGSVLALICVFLVCHFAKINRLYSIFNSEKRPLRFITINIFIIVFFISLYFKTNKNNFYESVLVILGCYLIIIVVNLEMASTRIKIIKDQNTILEQKNQLIEQKNTLLEKEAELGEKDRMLKAYDDYLPVVDELITEIRQRQHNYNDKLQALYALPVTHKDYDSLTLALQEESTLNSLSSIPSALLKLDMKVLAGFLFSKIKESEKQNKYMEISIPSPCYSSSVPEYILVEMIGILINNALEETCEGECIKIMMDCGGGSFCFEIKNPGEPFSEKQKIKIFEAGYTTKNHNDSKKPPETSRGFGLSGLKRLTEEYDCDIILDNDTEDGKNYIVFRLITND